jgi:Leucine-rich repeat (LRR) protein
MRSLQVLELSSNRLREVPAALADCPRLRAVDLTSNPLADKKLLKLAGGGAGQSKQVQLQLRAVVSSSEQFSAESSSESSPESALSAGVC